MIDGLFSNTNYVASKRLLDMTQLRHEAIASNIANVETPGYKRVDLPKDFSKEFAARLRSGTLDRLRTPSLVEDTKTTSQRHDGNNVEIDKELLEMSANTTQYDTLTEFVSNSLRQLKVAITGRS
ncbi:MAG: flagellar basal body rod protein FlgB [Chthoniobacteraceae bacterium]|nr:flagellar basal body rod protein FlgB [Chthoniobacteraceae bacterium]